MCRECRELFSRQRLQMKPLVSDPGIYHGTCLTHVPWCMSRSLTRGDGETSSAFPVHAQPAILRIWQKAHCSTVMWWYAALPICDPSCPPLLGKGIIRIRPEIVARRLRVVYWKIACYMVFILRKQCDFGIVFIAMKSVKYHINSRHEKAGAVNIFGGYSYIYVCVL